MTEQERDAYIAKQPIAVRIVAMLVSVAIMLGAYVLIYDFMMARVTPQVVYVTEPAVVKSQGQLASEAYVDRQLAKINANR